MSSLSRRGIFLAFRWPVPLGLENLTEPFTFEIYYQDRVAILGKNGTGKSHFLRRLSGDETVRYTGTFKLGARVVPGFFAQTHAHPEFIGKTLLEILWNEHSLQLGAAKSVLGRYELDQQAEQQFTSLSGGQQARFQVLLLELAGDTLLLLDEPTDNLDLASAEALERALSNYQGTVIAVTHDRWFARGFTRFLIFGAEGQVYESQNPSGPTDSPYSSPILTPFPHAGNLPLLPPQVFCRKSWSGPNKEVRRKRVCRAYL